MSNSDSTKTMSMDQVHGYDITHSYLAGIVQSIPIGYFSGYETPMKIDLTYHVSGKLNNQSELLSLSSYTKEKSRRH